MQNRSDGKDLSQAHVQPSRRQSGLVGRELLTKAEVNPVEVNRKALAELNTDEVTRRTDIRYPIFNNRCPITDIRYPMSDIRYICYIQ